MKHTPGPWRVGKNLANQATVEPTNNRHFVIATVPLKSEEDYANAVLMAAAPDLLEALKDLLQTMLNRGEHLGLDDRGPVLDKARAALTKATK